MTKRFVLVSLIAVLLGLLALPIFAQEEGDVELRWRTRPDNDAEVQVYTAASEAIDAAWDGVTLKYEPGGSETASYQDILIAEIDADTAPDVFWIPGTDVARFAEAGLILNLAEYAAADEEYSEEDFYAAPMLHLTTALDEGDALWGLPRDVSAFGLYYNQDLFDAAGVPYPGDGEAWTWDEFYDAAAAIRALGDDVYGFGMNAWWANPGYFINAAGSSFFTEDFKACGLNNEGTVEGLAFARSLYADDLAVPYGTDSEPPFLAGSVGMFMNGRWATPGVVANATFNWNVAPLPDGPAGPSNWLFWGAYVVNAKTDYPAEAWDLVTRLTSAEIQGSIASLGANIPSRQTEDAIELFLGTLPDSGVNNQAFVDGAAAGVAEAPLFFGDWPQIDAVYGAGFTAVLNGELDPQDFANTVCDQVAEFFDAE
ncbi:MAG: sugar ABC transporter substrate-binding protein [Anaerolineae bacterium]|jgi:multiple sugar transport system substrate-binding protein|nr:sugar ABC transporter substrate-binding protein [Anaerolineae bacterium]